MAGVRKGFLLWAENWLLLTPAIFLVPEWLFLHTETFDLHLHDTYFIIAGSHVYAAILVLLIIPYLCHILLRLQQKRNKVVLNTHIIATILLLLFLFFAIWQYKTMPRRYYDFSSGEVYQQFARHNHYSGIAFLTFTGTQLLFILYTIVRSVMKKRVHQ